MAQRYDNEARQGRIKRAKQKVSELVKKGYRLNPAKASFTYHRARVKHAVGVADKRQAMRDMERRGGGW